MVKALENAALSIDHVQEIEIMEMEDVAKYVRNTSAKVDAFPPMMKEVYDDHITNKGRNTILISEEYVMYLHHYGELYTWSI
jgi:hypothetical protein